MTAVHDGADVHDLFLGSVLSGGDSLPVGNSPRRLGRHDRRLPDPGAVDAAGDSAHLRRGRGPRRRGVKGAVLFPHNIGLGATRNPELVAARRPGHRARDRRQRRALGLRPLHRGGARRALGPHVRELRRIARAGRDAGRRRRARLQEPATPAPSWPAPSTSWATAARSRGKDQGDTRVPRRGAAPHPPARLRRGHQGRRRQRDGVVLQLERRADARQRPPDHRRPQGRAGLQRVRGQRLGGHRPDVRRLRGRHRARRQRRDRHDHGADPVPRVHRRAEGAGGRRAHRRRRASTTPSAAS